MIKKINYDLFNENLFILNLSNGLNVNLVPRDKFHQTYGTLTVRYGSINNEFISQGQHAMKKYPNGIAHFLEHKLFEKKDYDAFDQFALYGADSNAFTSFTRTSYIFSTADNVDKCTQTLLDFVQNPFFSEKTVSKEKGIIAQEIKMYEDDPSWQLLFGLISNLYPKTVLTTDIAGSVESIQQITPEMLYECYHEFYQPFNMSLMLVGNFDLEKIIQVIKHQEAKISTQKHPIQQNNLFDNLLPVIPFGQKQMSVQRPILGIGIRKKTPIKQSERLIYRAALELTMELLFGESAKDYQYLYDEGIIDGSFNYEIQIEDGFNFVTLNAETNHVEKTKDALLNILMNADTKLMQQKDVFEYMKHEFIGRYIKSMNYNEGIADRFDKWLYGEKTIFDVPQLIANLTITDLVQLANDLFKKEEITEFVINPKES